MVPGGWLGSGQTTLPDALGHYVRDVLRLRPSDTLEALDGEGQAAQLTIVAFEKRSVQVRLEPPFIMPPPPGPAITLIQALGKNDKLDHVIRQSVELGVRTILPVITERAVARHEHRLERWQTIAEDALRISGRPLRPTIFPIQPLENLWSQPRAPLSLCFAAEGRSLAELWAPAAAVELLVGPEGGFSATEIKSATDAGFRLASLGRYVLRTDTAGPAVVALASFLGGGLAT